MNAAMLRRIAPVIGSFVLVAIGVLVLAGGNRSSSASADDLTPTVVAISGIDAGTSVADLGPLVEMRMLPADARAQGAVSSVGDLGSGVTAAPIVAGQQVLRSSLVADVREDLGRGLVAVSAKLDPAQWAGPVATTGSRVDVYAIGGATAELIARGVVVLDAPDPATLTPQQETIVTLGVQVDDVPRVIGAVSGAGIWLVTA